MRENFPTFVIAFAITALIFWYADYHAAKKNKKKIDLLYTKLSLFKVILEVVILIYVKT